MSRSPISIKLHEPTFGEEEIAAVVDVMRSTQITSGEKVREFEREFAPNAVMCNSGSSANLLAISALCNPLTEDRLKPGDEVIVSALSWSTTVWPLVQHGLVPVIVDIDPETLNVDPDEVFRACGDLTRAFMPVHVYGNPCDIDEIPWNSSHRIIEDCCEALGAKYAGEPVGSLGHIGTFSFYFSHHITTGEGGMVVTGDPKIAEMLRILRAHGWLRDVEDGDQWRTWLGIDPRFLFVNAGYNLRCTEMQAAMGLVQLPKLAGFVEARRGTAARLLGVFRKYDAWLGTQLVLPGAKSSWFGFPVVVREKAPFTVDDLRAHFEANGIETRSIICGNIARQPGMRLWPHRIVGDLKHADHVMRNGFSIGCHQAMDDVDCRYISDTLDEFMETFA